MMIDHSIAEGHTANKNVSKKHEEKAPKIMGEMGKSWKFLGIYG